MQRKAPTKLQAVPMEKIVTFPSRRESSAKARILLHLTIVNTVLKLKHLQKHSRNSTMFSSTQDSEKWSDFQDKFGSNLSSPPRRGVVRSISGSSLRALTAAVGVGGEKKERRRVFKTTSLSDSRQGMVRSGSAKSLNLAGNGAKKSDVVTLGGRRRRPRKSRSNVSTPQAA